MIDMNIRPFELSCLLLVILMEVTSGMSLAEADAEADANSEPTYGQARNYTNEDKDYGVTWMYIPDGNGVPQVAFLTEESETSRGRKKNAKDYVRFELYTQKSGQPKVMQMNKRKRRSVDDFAEAFDKDLPTYVIVHGWKSSSQSDTVQDIKDNYLKTKDCNVIAVDWNELASNNFYFTPARQTRDVGKTIAEMIDFMCSDRGADINKFHLIGHSLGAHTVGYAGMYTKSGKIPRITGLDPAKPMFENTSDNDGSLDKSDAEFVDIIHSCAGLLGYTKPLGHVDFYPNGGRASQPGCQGIYKELLEACSHGRSHQYYAASILKANVFTAYPCSSYESYQAGTCNKQNGIRMGDPVPKTARGVYYLKTSGTSPYAQGR
ncbi:lipase member H-like [Contarinia nasturtii]|uniref:lipase member H-like n=1 Tax=Contarinia nasturtii TaxID=265458 RepID=UPI0012D41160|nr:lipase member H-like [Contarinia nasturtii]XP_031632245.1 lipase member H-like [Contarinia nasturtii]